MKIGVALMCCIASTAAAMRLKVHGTEPERSEQENLSGLEVGCKSVKELAASVQAHENLDTALQEWCGEGVSEMEWGPYSAGGRARWKSCRICLMDCPYFSAEEPKLFLYWLTLPPVSFFNRSLQFNGDMLLGGEDLRGNISTKPARQGSSCASFDVKGDTSHLHLLGGVGKELTGVCTELGMTSIAYLHVAVVKALGMSWIEAEDRSNFLDCGQSQVWTMIPKIATKGRTLYQGFYGESLSFGHRSRPGMSAMCPFMVENSHEFAVANGFDIVASNLLEETKRLSKAKPKRGQQGLAEWMNMCKAALRQYDLLERSMAPVAGKWKACWNFKVEVELAPSCGSG